MTLDESITRWAEPGGEPLALAAELFGSLFDDAALFPPREASAAEAVAGHAAWRRSAYSVFVGPFVCSGAQWPAVHDELPSGHTLRVALTLPKGVESARDTISMVSAGGALVTQVELPVGAGGVEQTLSDLRHVIPDEVVGYAEIPIAQVSDEVCAALGQHSLRLKLRTGGVTAASFPTEEVLASAIARCVRHQLPFKLTAGLHGAVRHHDAATGFEHHGFLNVILATAAAIRGSDVAGVATILAVDSGPTVASAMRTLNPDITRAVRNTFISLGTCSIEEPLDDLRRLGLLGREA